MRTHNETKYFDPPYYKSKMTPVLLCLIAYQTLSQSFSSWPKIGDKAWPKCGPSACRGWGGGGVGSYDSSDPPPPGYGPV